MGFVFIKGFVCVVIKESPAGVCFGRGLLNELKNGFGFCII